MADGPLPERVRRAAGGMWALRAAAELEAELRFRRIAEGLRAVGSPANLVELAARSADDEARHHVLCVEAAARFGVAVTSRGPAPVPTGPAPARERVLIDVIAMCCVTETVSAALLAEMLRETTDPRLHAIVREVLTDEVRHSRLGWGHLAFEAARGDVAFVGAALPGILQGTVTDEVFAELQPDDVGAALLPYGGLPRARRREVFVAAVEQLVLPGLAQHGIDGTAARAWLDERGARPADTEDPAS